MNQQIGNALMTLPSCTGTHCGRVPHFEVPTHLNDIFPYTALEIGFIRSQIVAAILGTFFCAWNALRMHWLANNILCLALCIQGIEMLSLGSFKTGAILLLAKCVEVGLPALIVMVFISQSWKNFDNLVAHRLMNLNRMAKTESNPDSRNGYTRVLPMDGQTSMIYGYGYGYRI